MLGYAFSQDELRHLNRCHPVPFLLPHSLVKPFMLVEKCIWKWKDGKVFAKNFLWLVLKKTFFVRNHNQNEEIEDFEDAIVEPET